SMISMNWRGRPLASLEVIVSLIAGTSTKTGLKIEASKSDKEYACGTKISDAELRKLRMLKGDFHLEWNYWIRPRKC
ncbi:MAG: ISAzo13 family transposase, partial [Desulfovibrio sp.]|nr:ISAzo13 family transposase [Desulfovibrio sp.]